MSELDLPDDVLADMEPEQDNRCGLCRGVGNLPSPSEGYSLVQCLGCNGTGCQHIVRPLEGHCSVCEQDENCLACKRNAPQPKPDDGDSVFEPCLHEAWETTGTSRRCTDCGNYLRDEESLDPHADCANPKRCSSRSCEVYVAIRRASAEREVEDAQSDYEGMLRRVKRAVDGFNAAKTYWEEERAELTVAEERLAAAMATYSTLAQPKAHVHTWEEQHGGRVFYNVANPLNAVSYEQCPCGEQRQVKWRRA